MSDAIVVFSHLRWNFVFQRPQQILGRLAQRHRVLFIEEPMPADEASRSWTLHRPAENVLVCQPRIGKPGEVAFNDDHMALLKPMLLELLEEQAIDEKIAWFYSPMAAPLADGLQWKAIVYDCMDELSAFFNPPPQLLDREQELLTKADVVFTGGRSIYRHKRTRHHNVHCFPAA